LAKNWLQHRLAASYLTVGQLIDSWDELPDVTEDEEPDDGDGDPSKSTLLLLSHRIVVVHEGVSTQNSSLAIDPIDVIPTIYTLLFAYF